MTPSPRLSLLIGPPCSGKSTYATRAFASTEIASADTCALAVSDGGWDGELQSRLLLRTLVEARCQLGKRTVVDALNLDPYRRWELRDIARARGLTVAALLFEVPLALLLERAQARRRQEAHPFPCDDAGLIRAYRQYQDARRAVFTEGYAEVRVLVYHKEHAHG